MALLTSSPTVDELVAEVEPVLRRCAAQSEAERRLAPEAMDALLDAGILQTWVPKAYGGRELDPISALRLFEELSHIDAAAGWIGGNSSAIASTCSVLPDEGSAEIFSHPRTLIAGAWNPPGTAVPVAGGYRVTGRWPFGSASSYADWLSALCLIMDGDAPRLGPDGTPAVAIVVFKASEAEVLDTWYTLGMRGTGSNDFRAVDVFVPERRAWPLGPFVAGGQAFGGPLYRLGVWIAGPQIAMTGLGIARAAIDDLIELAATKTPSYTQTGLADRPVVQDRIARARALVEAARSYIYTAIGDAWEFVQSGERITAATGVPLGLAGSFGGEAAAQAVGMVHAMAGTSAIRNEHRFQQHFRDVNTISQHAFGSACRFESLGKLMLGRESDWAFYHV